MSLSNSSLQPWFNFSNTFYNYYGPIDDTENVGISLALLLAELPPIQPCVVGDRRANCSEVCQNNSNLFDPHNPSNLVTCGLWATLTAYLDRSGLSSTSVLSSEYASEGQDAFTPVGLSLYGTNSGSRSSFESNVIDCVADFYAASHIYSGDNLGTPYSCSKNNVFRLGNRVESCFVELCTPKKMNADIGGIGVCAVNPGSSDLATILIEFY